MRETTLRPAQARGGIGLLVVGAGLAILSLVLILLSRGGGTSNGPATAPTSLSDPYETTNGSVTFWEQRVESDPADFVAYNRLASAFLQRARETGDVSDYARTQTAVDASLAELPGDNYSGYALLASLQNIRHEFAEAIKTANRARPLDPSDPYVFAVLGDAQLNLGLYGEAFESYTALVSMAPGLSSFSRMAHIFELQGDVSNAEAAWENAFSTNGGRNAENTAWARVQYGNFLFGQGRIADASAQYAEANETFPDYIHALAGEARIAAANGDYDRAIGLLTTVTSRQPLPEYVTTLGDVYAVAGQTAEAQRQYDLIAAIEDLYQANGINTDLQTAAFLADHDLRPDDALEQALAVHALQPDSIYAADAVAWALLKAGRGDEALPYAVDALRLNTQDASLWYHAGMIHYTLGNEDQAREHLQTALDINADFSVLQAPIAQQTLEDLSR